jgi:hypothetical protein
VNFHTKEAVELGIYQKLAAGNDDNEQVLYPLGQ